MVRGDGEMRLEGQFTVGARPEDVYAYLTDPRQVSRQMPDVAAVEIQDDDHFSVTARVGVAHIKGTMVMKLEIRDRQPPVSTTVVGKGSGLASVVDMVTSFRLEPIGPAADDRPLAGGRDDFRQAGGVRCAGAARAASPGRTSTRSSRESGRDSNRRWFTGLVILLDVPRAGTRQ